MNPLIRKTHGKDTPEIKLRMPADEVNATAKGFGCSTSELLSSALIEGLKRTWKRDFRKHKGTLLKVGMGRSGNRSFSISPISNELSFSDIVEKIKSGESHRQINLHSRSSREYRIRYDFRSDGDTLTLAIARCTENDDFVIFLTNQLLRIGIHACFSE